MNKAKTKRLTFRASATEVGTYHLLLGGTRVGEMWQQKCGEWHFKFASGRNSKLAENAIWSFDECRERMLKFARQERAAGRLY